MYSTATRSFSNTRAHTHLYTHSLHLSHTYIAHTCQHDTKPGTPGTLITAMPSYQLLRRPVGEGGFLVVAIAAGLLPANSLPRGETRQEVGGEVGRGRGQQFNRAMRCRGTSLAITVQRTNHCFPWMPTHMLHFSLQTSTYSRTAHRPPLIHTPIWRRRWELHA